MKPLRVDVGLPVYNEERTLRRSVERLHAHLSEHSRAAWRVVIVDNGSTDATPAVARELSRALDNIEYVRVSVAGKGGAVRELITRSEADVVAFMDIDLSSDLRYFNLLVDGIACGYDISTGTRLMHGARVQRSFKREIASRVFNTLVKLMFAARFSDASCGFKAFRTETAKRLVQLVESDSWCFDVELMLVAERNRLRIFEIPIDWVEDADSKIRLASATAEHLSELLRIRATLHQKRL
ncbi:MAG: glycosyltransferase [Myxococcales bacterium]|nr:glycosyltransferase [Myxococcales bacterium]